MGVSLPIGSDSTGVSSFPFFCFDSASSPFFILHQELRFIQTATQGDRMNAIGWVSEESEESRVKESEEEAARR
jgi:hypothetical protein